MYIISKKSNKKLTFLTLILLVRLLLLNVTAYAQVPQENSSSGSIEYDKSSLMITVSNTGNNIERQEFVFRIEQGDTSLISQESDFNTNTDIPKPSQTDISIVGEGRVSFSQINFSDVNGSQAFVYKISEVQGSNAQVIYDDSVYNLVVYVHNGLINQAVLYDGTREKVDNIIFKNSFTDKPRVEIDTVLKDSNNKKSIAEKDSVTLIDAVNYKGLTPGRTYVFEAELFVKETNKPLEIDRKAVKVMSNQFSPTESDGQIDVSLSINTKRLGDKHIVCYETVYLVAEQNLEKVAEHKDINDLNQTISVDKSVPPSDPDKPTDKTKNNVPNPVRPITDRVNAQTGDYIMLGVLIVLVVSTIGFIYYRRKNNE